MAGELSYEGIVSGLVGAGVRRDKAEDAAAAEIAKRLARSGLAPPTPTSRVVKTIGANGFAVPSSKIERVGDTVTARYDLPPRTKKNSTFLGIRQSPAYVRFCQGVVDASEGVVTELQLPLPAIPFNLAATFYVDSKGKPADLIGLIQGTADALEAARIVVNDFWFKRLDGSCIVYDDPTPRVEVVITPIEE